MRTYTLLLIAALLTSLVGCGSSRDSSRHWKRIDEYNEYLHNPKNRKRDEHGLGYIDDIPDIMPSLHALEKMGEIIHVFLVFPNVPQSEEVSRYWLRYVSDIPEIIYATGPSVSYAGDETYRTKGVQPFYTNLWFKPTAEEKVKELIHGIEEFGENKEGPSTTE